MKFVMVVVMLLKGVFWGFWFGIMICVEVDLFLVEFNLMMNKIFYINIELMGSV